MLPLSKDEENLEFLRQQPFLEGIRADVLQRLYETAIERCYQPGDILLLEGSIDREMLLILKGSVEVIKDAGSSEVILSRNGAGAVFGEMGFFNAQPRFATVRAVEVTGALELSESSLRQALIEQPKLLFHSLQLLSARLRESQEHMITDLRKKNLELERAYHELQDAQADLVDKERLERELELACELQQSFLPHEFPSLPGVQCAALNLPARQVGGDFYDVIPLSENRLGLVIGDVSDKGMPAALFMVLSRSLIRAEAQRSDSPRKVLLAVNHLLQELNQSSMLVTVFFGVLDISRGFLTYVRAGHDRPLLLRAANNECVVLDSQGIVLGVLEEIELEEVQIVLNSGDRLVLYTDGITDAMNPEGELFDLQRLEDLVCSAGAASARELCDAIFDHVEQYQAGTMQYDDMTVMVISLEGRCEEQ
jgi:serine phosphatase RsbU (regulator of sigma subunit)